MVHPKRMIIEQVNQTEVIGATSQSMFTWKMAVKLVRDNIYSFSRV